MSRLAGVFRRAFGVVREHVGTDHLGNKYYIIPEQKTWTGRVVRSRRLVEAVNPSEFEYLEGSVPVEWDAWIRGRRKEPPTNEEVLHNLLYQQQIKLKALEVDQKEQKDQEEQEGLGSRTVALGHGSASHFGPETQSEEPTSTSNSFKPGSWTPTSKT
ncbi:unnamed protein product [Knipowitschia caucasica]|uniref:NADH dehydrogenase [ubiquinone] 1 alpha subcomplex subunit 12 n=1 Tax=Knipowitschia caucasica TaxID=637954 RepID=A0AAV2MNK8_KNICA